MRLAVDPKNILDEVDYNHIRHRGLELEGLTQCLQIPMDLHRIVHARQAPTAELGQTDIGDGR